MDGDIVGLILLICGVIAFCFAGPLIAFAFAWWVRFLRRCFGFEEVDKTIELDYSPLWEVTTKDEPKGRE